jgi:hypothetical protein
VAETAAFDEYRAELIARTESARVLNDSQLETFREFDVEQVTAIDGDDDEVCADRNGQTFDIDEAMDIEDHPNGTLDWVPVVKAKATHSPAPAKAHTDTLARLQAQVADLEARIAAQDVAVKANVLQDVRVVEMPSRRSTAVKKVKRDRAGLIVEVTEQEIEE